MAGLPAFPMLINPIHKLIPFGDKRFHSMMQSAYIEIVPKQERSLGLGWEA